ncbi:phage minor tail protein [Mizugakiibacter sediminis]|uniref:Phage minor tail protein n=1 Tax=Mizugakiibacter sediminis TaxID=1475481 RepID=A0A0K8QQ55_9GAMM|nr:phage tail protein [Mizugakiibacter sediminis]GAP66831.1 phage minor tail protein [Mizugakiibacter sediminis]
MSTPTFTWQATGNPTGTVSFRVRTAQFGDGYKQTVADGINNKVQSWPLTFTGTKAEMQAIVNFFDERAGWQSFYWTPPLGVQGLYKVTTYSPTPKGGPIYTVTATFEQAFAP